MEECPEERFDEMLCILPPAQILGKGLLVGKSFDHRTCSVTKSCAGYRAAEGWMTVWRLSPATYAEAC
jgi:hypothetical protein